MRILFWFKNASVGREVFSCVPLFTFQDSYGINNHLHNECILKVYQGLYALIVYIDVGS